jgi:uncharacterized protein YdhG (YjbR/CyaY superfamily)
MAQRPDGLDALLAPLDPARRSEVEALDARIRRRAPGLAASISGGMVNYGDCRYTYASGRSGNSPSLAIAPRATGISVYVGFMQVERWADRLPRASCGKGCIRVKRAADIDQGVLDEIVAWAQSTDGQHLDWTGLPQDGPPNRRPL